MPRRAYITKPNGLVAVIMPACERRDGEADADYLRRISRSVPAVRPRVGESEDDFIIRVARDYMARRGYVGPIKIAHTSTFPNRTFREAWSDGGSTITVDMPKARVIHMDRIRVERNKELERQDNLLKVAEDAGDTVEIARVRAERQRLRDIPQTFDLSVAQTPQALDAMWPPGLNRER